MATSFRVSRKMAACASLVETNGLGRPILIVNTLRSFSLYTINSTYTALLQVRLSGAR